MYARIGYHTCFHKGSRYATAVSCSRHQSVIPEQIRSQQQRPDVDSLCSWIGSPLGEGQRLIDIKQYQSDEKGWGLCAIADIDSGSLLVDVPMEYTIHGSDILEADVPWNVQMVERLLENGGLSGWKDWVQAMPTDVDLPWIGWTQDEIDVLEDVDIIREIHELRGFLQDQSLRGYLEKYAWEDVQWAFSMVHSRSFLYGNQHIFVPIIDMANHSPTCNASVRVKFSPGTCQGREAEEEIAPVRESVEPSTFQLVASKDISRGDEITISYGSLCNDVLLLYFGFALPENEHDQVVVFQNTDEACTGICQMLGIPRESFPRKSLPEENRLFVMKQGADPRLLQLIASLIDIGGMTGTHSVGGVLRMVCEHHLKSFSTSLDEDREALLKSKDSRHSLALSFRYNKKAILHTILACL